MIVLLGGLAAIPPLAIDLYLPAFPSLASEFDATASEVQLTLAAFFLGEIIGMLASGPASDRYGRKRPMLLSVGGVAVASVLCALAPSVYVLVGLRFAQGVCTGAATVLPLAVVGDLASGGAAARIVSWITLVALVGPVVGPLLGSQLLAIGSWRWTFVALAVYGVAWALLLASYLPETLPASARRAGSAGSAAGVFKRVLADRQFLGYAVGGALVSAAFFAYLAGSSLVLQDAYGLSPGMFGVVFALNSVGLMIATQVSRLLLRRTSPRNVALAGATISTTAAIVLLAIASSAEFGLIALLVAIFFVVSGHAMVIPSSSTLALASQSGAAGSASSLIYVLMIGLGGATGPLVGIGGTGSALPMAIVIAAMSTAGLLTLLFVPRGSLPRGCLGVGAREVRPGMNARGRIG